MRTKDSNAVSVRLRFADHARLGPGKMALLEAVQRTGSIAEAAGEMNMSLRRAWMLLDSINAMFDTPAVLVDAGPDEERNPRLTDLGRQVLAAFRAAEAEAQQSVARHFAALLPRLRAEPPEHGTQGPTPGA